MLTFKYKVEKTVNKLPSNTHQNRTKHNVYDDVNTTIQNLNILNKNLKNIICRFCFWPTCDLETQSKSSNWHEQVDPKLGYNHEKF